MTLPTGDAWDDILMECAPSVVFVINNDAPTTASTEVTLNINATIGGVAPTEMCFKNETGGTWSAWEPYATTKPWTIENPALGTKRVYVKFRM